METWNQLLENEAYQPRCHAKKMNNRRKRCDAGVRNIIVEIGIIMKAFVEDHSIKHAIKEVSQCACIDQGGTDYKPTAVLLFDDPAKIPGTKNDCCQPE